MDRKRGLGREVVGLGILLALLAAGLFSSWEMSSAHYSISRQVEDAAWFALSEDWEAARTAAAAAENQWEEHRDLSSLLADHTPMEQIDALFARMDMYSAARDTAEFAAACGELSRYVKAMGDAHRLTWQNLL